MGRERGRKKSEAEAKYRTALAKKILLERDKGTPVTIINDICRGDEEIAKLKLERDIAETMYESCLQMIFNCRQSREIILEFIRQEWSVAGNFGGQQVGGLRA